MLPVALVACTCKLHRDCIGVHDQLDVVHMHVCCMKCSGCATSVRVSCPNHSSYVCMNLTVLFQDSINIVVSVCHGSNPSRLRHRRVYACWHGVWACVMYALQQQCNRYASNAQKSTSEHTDLPPIISGDFSTRSTAVCVHVVDKNPFRWRTTPMHRYTQQIFMYSPQQMYWYIEHTVFLKI